MNAATGCGCKHSLAVICGIFASVGVALLLAEHRCRDSGGRVSDAAWLCEAASGGVSSLWSLVTPGIVALAILVGIPVYFAVSALASRWLPGGLAGNGRHRNG
jgi:hypothetical protein